MQIYLNFIPPFFLKVHTRKKGYNVINAEFEFKFLLNIISCLFLYRNSIYLFFAHVIKQISHTMKKLVVILALCLFIGTIISSCNREVCPAYSQAEVEQAEEIV